MFFQRISSRHTNFRGYYLSPKSAPPNCWFTYAAECRSRPLCIQKKTINLADFTPYLPMYLDTNLVTTGRNKIAAVSLSKEKLKFLTKFRRNIFSSHLSMKLLETGGWNPFSKTLRLQDEWGWFPTPSLVVHIELPFTMLCILCKFEQDSQVFLQFW